MYQDCIHDVLRPLLMPKPMILDIQLRSPTVPYTSRQLAISYKTRVSVDCINVELTVAVMSAEHVRIAPPRVETCRTASHSAKKSYSVPGHFLMQ